MAERLDTVEVQVGYWEGPLENPGRFVGHKVRYTGRLIHTLRTGYEILRLYRCPEGFRVHENDDLLGRKDGGYELYPGKARGGPREYGYYTAEELLEEWPELARAVGITGGPMSQG